MTTDAQGQMPAPPQGGVLVARWTTLRIPAGGIVIRMNEDDGSTEVDPVKVELSLAMWPHWLDMALRHASAAARAHKQVMAAHEAGDSEGLHKALNEEFQASVQAIAAAGFCLDGLYGELDAVAVIPQPTRDTWTKNRTSRAKRLAEVVRLTCDIQQSRFTTLRTGILTMFRFRDEAVHPAARFAEPLLHPDLHVGVDPRLIAYRAENAQAALGYGIEALLFAFERPQLQGPDDQRGSGDQVQIVHQILDDHGVTIKQP